jgi:hypothetical protein
MGCLQVIHFDAKSKVVLGVSQWKTSIMSYAALYEIVCSLHAGDTDLEHNGVIFMLRHFQKSYFLPGIRDLLREYLACCEGCQVTGNVVGNSKRIVYMPIVSKAPLSHMQLDVSLHPEDVNTGARYTCGMKCLFTGYIWMLHFLTKDSELIAIWMLDVFTHEGVRAPPEGFVCSDITNKSRVKVHTDNGAEFVNQALQKVVDLYRAKHVRGLPWQPWVQGGIERVHRELKRGLSNNVDGYREGGRCAWVASLQDVVYRMNQQPNDARLGGATPFFCLRGFDPNAQGNSADTDGDFKKRVEVKAAIQVSTFSYLCQSLHIQVHLIRIVLGIKSHV